MIAWVRFRPYLPIALWLLLVLLLVNGALRGLQATSALNWLPKVTSGRGFMEDGRQRVAGAAREYEQGSVRPDEYLCAIVGLSNVREAIPLKVVAAEAKLPCRYLGLGGAGVGMADMVAQTKLLLQSELRPDLVILGVGPHQMVDTRPKPRLLKQGLLESLRRADWRNAAVAIRNWLWFYSRREDVSLSVDAALLDARAGLFHRFGVSMPQAQSDHRSPWRDMLKTITAEHFSQATLQEEEHFFAEMGVFDAETYAHSPKAQAGLIDLIKRLRERGATVVIVFMPEHSQLRHRMPPNISTVVAKPLHKGLGANMPAILDLRAAIEDSGFVDLTHLNERGAARCGRLIGEKIRDFLPRRPPLMNSSVNDVSPKRKQASAERERLVPLMVPSNSVIVLSVNKVVPTRRMLHHESWHLGSRHCRTERRIFPPRIV